MANWKGLVLNVKRQKHHKLRLVDCLQQKPIPDSLVRRIFMEFCPHSEQMMPPYLESSTGTCPSSRSQVPASFKSIALAIHLPWLRAETFTLIKQEMSRSPSFYEIYSLLDFCPMSQRSISSTSRQPLPWTKPAALGLKQSLLTLDSKAVFHCHLPPETGTSLISTIKG